jgi:phosphate transport system permease protein
VIALPLGVATAIFIAEIVPRWMREFLKPLVEVLAGIPSVVIGFVGMLVIVPMFRVALDIPTGLTAFTGIVLLAWMALPTVVSVVEDVLDTVPRTYRDAGLALGMTRWQTISRIVVPAGKSGILTALMLGVGRAIGETMTVMMVTGNAPRMPGGLSDIFAPTRTMTATIAAEMGEVATGSTHYHVLFAVGLALFVITFVINLAAAAVTFQHTKRAERMLS